MKADQAEKLDAFKKMTDTEKEHEYVSLLDQYDELEALYCENTNTVTVLVKEIIKLNAKLEKQKEELLRLNKIAENYTELQRKCFGSSSERFSTNIPADQDTASCDQENDSETDAQTTEQDQDKGDANTPEEKENENKPVTNNTRRSHKGNPNKQRGRRNAMYDRLPKKLRFCYDEEYLDSLYGKGNWRIFTWRSSRSVKHFDILYAEYVFTPVISVGLEHVLEDPYASETNVLKKYIASPELIAHVIHSKTVLGLPLYRLESKFARLGFELSRQCMSKWFNDFATKTFRNVYRHMAAIQKSCKYQQGDETFLTVIQRLTDPDDPRKHCVIWVHATGELDKTVCPVIVFEYNYSRSADVPQKYYEDCKDIPEIYLTDDAYGAYGKLVREMVNIIQCGCLMHARRRFYIAYDLLVKNSKNSETDLSDTVEYKTLSLIQRMYQIDTPAKSLTADERLSIRQAEIEPIFQEWIRLLKNVDTEDPVYSAHFVDAVRYSLNNEKNLHRFLEDGNIPIDNGFSERSIRLLAISRRNFLFAFSEIGAEALAINFTLVETARANGADSECYLRYLIENMYGREWRNDDEDPEFLESMMPWSDAYRSYEQDQKNKWYNDLGLVPPNTEPQIEFPKPSRNKKQLSDTRSDTNGDTMPGDKKQSEETTEKGADTSSEKVAAPDNERNTDKTIDMRKQAEKMVSLICGDTMPVCSTMSEMKDELTGKLYPPRHIAMGRFYFVAMNHKGSSPDDSVRCRGPPYQRAVLSAGSIFNGDKCAFCLRWPKICQQTAH